AAPLNESGQTRLPCRNSGDIRSRRSFDAQVFAHVAVILVLAALSAQVEAQLIDDLDAVVFEPVLPAIGTDFLVDLLAKVIGHGRPGQLAGMTAGHAARTLTAEAVSACGRTLRGRHRLAQLREHLAHV